MAAVPIWGRNTNDSARQVARVQEYVDQVRGNAEQTRSELRRVFMAYAQTRESRTERR